MAIKGKIKKDPTDDEAAEKIKDAVKATKKASKQRVKNELKAAADKMLLSMAEKTPHSAGGAKAFLARNKKLDELEEKKAVINLAIRGVRGELRQDKVNLEALDRVRKLRKKDPEDVKALKASEALYEAELGMELSPEQKKITDELTKRREESRKVILQANGGDTGKEVGSAVKFGAKTDPEVVNDPPAFAKRPEKNEAVAASFRSPSTAAH